MKIFAEDDCLSRRDIDLRYIVNISRFKNLAEEFEVKSYILEYMYQYNKNLSFSDISKMLSIYDRAIKDKKDINFADYIKYIFRYVIAEDVSISSALKQIDSSYEYINKFKGAFSSSFYNNSMLKDKIGVEKFSFLEELSKCKSFDAIYKKLVC